MVLTMVNIHEAKTHFSKLVARAAAGEEIVITKAGEPMCKLVSAFEADPATYARALEGED